MMSGEMMMSGEDLAWFSQPQMDHMRRLQNEDETGFYAGVVRRHDAVYHSEGQQGTCCTKYDTAEQKSN